jgi:hypothetical protein
MRPLIALGLVLIVAGIAGLVIVNVSFTEHRTVLDAGPIKITEEQQKTVPIPTIAGIAAVVGGLCLIFVGRKRRA